MNSNDSPIYVGHIARSFAYNKFEVYHAVESKAHRCWVITVRSCESLWESYALKVRNGFARDQSPYSIEPFQWDGALPEPIDIPGDCLLDDIEYGRVLSRISHDESSKPSGVCPESVSIP